MGRLMSLLHGLLDEQGHQIPVLSISFQNRNASRSFTCVGVAQDISAVQHKGVTAEHGHRCDYVSIGSTIRAISSLDEDINSLCLVMTLTVLQA